MRLSHSGSLSQKEKLWEGFPEEGQPEPDPQRASPAGLLLGSLWLGVAPVFLRVMKSEDDPEDGENILGDPS